MLNVSFHSGDYANIAVHDYTGTTTGRDHVGVDIGLHATMHGTLDELLAFFGSVHSQLQALYAARLEAAEQAAPPVPARAVLSHDGDSCRLETAEGETIGKVTFGTGSGVKVGHHLIVRRAGDRWAYVASLPFPSGCLASCDHAVPVIADTTEENP